MILKVTPSIWNTNAALSRSIGGYGLARLRNGQKSARLHRQLPSTRRNAKNTVPEI
jgi:hypothetical protein